MASRWPKLTRHEQVWLALASLGAALGSILVLPQAWWLTRVVDRAFLAHASVAQVSESVTVLAGIYLLRGGLVAFARWAAAEFAGRVQARLRSDLFEQLLALGPVTVRSRPSGEWLAWLGDGIDRMEAYLANYLPQSVSAVLTPLAIFAFAAAEDGWTALVLAITVPLLALLMVLVGMSAQAATNKQWQALERLSGHFLDVVRGLQTLRSFGRSHVQATTVEQMAERYRAATMKVLTLAFLSSLVMELFSMISIGLVAVSLGLRLVSGHMEFARAFVLLLLAPEFYQPIRMAGSQFHAARDGVAMLQRWEAVMQTEPPGLAEPSGGRTLPPSRRGYTIEFRHVTAVYPGTSTPVLQDVCFRVNRGQTLAILGPSGTGKSTLLAILLGFLRPVQGEVLIDGIPLHELSLACWRDQLGYLPQQPTWFHGTLRDNVSLDAVALDEQVAAALRLARFDPALARLPAGLDTVLDGERIRLSGGEQQRLALARLILHNPPVVLLDEPTRALDLETEAALEETLLPWLRSRTALLVVHRLGLAMRADQVLVLEDGLVREIGSPKTLLEAGGRFASLYRNYHGDEVVRV